MLSIYVGPRETSRSLTESNWDSATQKYESITVYTLCVNIFAPYTNQLIDKETRARA